MAFGSIEFTTISRSQEYTTIKQNEDNKGFTDQANIGQHIQKESKERISQVRSSDNSEWHNRKFDAKDKGSNEYNGDGGRRNKQQKMKDQVVIKGQQGFDMKV